MVCHLELLHTNAALAQTPADEFVRQQEQKAQAQRLLDLADQTPNRARLDGHSQDARPANDTCFPIASVVVAGGDRFAIRLEAVAAAFKNRCIGTTDINTLLRAITNIYLDHGFITSRAYIPEQDLAQTGILRIQVIEGILEEVRINGKPAHGKTERLTAFPGMERQIANMRDVEQGLDQINRLRSRKAKSEFLPGESEGSSILNVTVEETRPWHIMIGNSNLGQESTGLSKTFAGITYDDLFGLNDILAFNYERSGPDYQRKDDGRGSSNSYSGTFSIPYGYWTYTLSGSWYDYSTSIPGAFGDIATTGTSDHASLAAERVVARGADNLTKIRAVVAYKESDNFLLGQKIEVGSRKYTVGSIGLSHSLRAMGSLWNVDFGLERGLGWLGAVDKGSPSAGDAEPRFTKVTAATSMNHPFSVRQLDLALSSQGSLQWSPDNLFGSEQISLGGWSSVRGSRDGLLFGNNGYFVRNELSMSLSPWKETEWASTLFGQLQPYLGLDFGHILSQPRYGISSGGAHALTAGARLTGGHISLDTGYSEIYASSDRKQNRQIFFFNISTQW